MVTFVSTDPKRPNASSTIQSDGSYDLATPEFGRGAQLGEYKVSVSGKDPEAYDKITAPGEPMKIASPVPVKYENPTTSGIQKTVVSGSNAFDLELQ
jgi:hypothetical protein